MFVFVCSEINGALVQHQEISKDLELLELAFRKAVVNCDEQMGDEAAFFPSSQPRDFAHKNRQLSRVSTHRREQEAEATERVNRVLEGPVLAEQVSPSLCYLSARSDKLRRRELKKKMSMTHWKPCSAAQAHSK